MYLGHGVQSNVQWVQLVRQPRKTPFADKIHSAPLDWSFPSPATPTNGSFTGYDGYQTPRANAYTPQFHDAFTTPQMQSHTTPQQLQYSTMTPLQRPQTSSDTLRSNYYANIQASGGQIAGQSMPPPASMVSPTYTQAASMQLATNTSFGSMQMQTPPPTRGTPSRKPQQEQAVAFGTPSTIASRRFMTPQQGLRADAAMPFGQHTPMQFSQLQFSPDMQQFGNVGPASAPVTSHSQIMWAQTGSPMQPVPSATLDDPFAPSSLDMSWTSAGYAQSNVQAVSFDTPAMNGFPVYTPQQQPVSTMERPVQPVNAIGMGPVSTAVDPSLLYSSPARPPVRSVSRTNKTRSQASGSYGNEHEQESQTHRRSDTSSSTSTVTRQSLQRSNTTGTTRSQRASMTAAESLSRDSSLNHITRTASPVKRMGRPSLGSISEGRPRQRTSVILTVDENGRARTVTQHIDPSPTRSVKDRYPALYDSDSSDAESDGSDDAPSRPLSFIFDKRDERRSKAARLDPPIENLEGLSIPRSGSAASMKKGVPPSRAAVAAVASLRRHSSLRRLTPSRNSNRRSVTLNSSSTIDTCPMDMPSTAQQHPVRADTVMDNESQSLWPPPGDRAESALEAHNRRWSIMSYEQNNALSISPQPQQAPSTNGPYPSNDTGHRLSGQLQIRCICAVTQVNAQPIIQCQSCTQWSHTICVGLQGHAATPGFTCFLCTRPPSNRPRGASQR